MDLEANFSLRIVQHSLADVASMRNYRIPSVTFEVIAKKEKGPSFGVSSESQCSEA